MSYCIDAAYESLCKYGEELCGDKVEIVRSGEDNSVVLSDGLGSGVKANILSTLTSKIIATMLAGGSTIDECIDTIADTLPVCSERGIAYSTFCILRVSDEGDASLVQYDCPESVLLVNGRVVEPEKKWREVNDKKIFEAKFRMKPGDMLVMFSDGVIHAGVGMLMNLGWQRENVVKYVEQAYQKNMSAIAMARQLLAACDSLYMQKPGDDTTVVAVRLRDPMPVYVMVGPPVDPENDERVVGELMSCKGKRVVCGGTTSQIVSKVTGRPLNIDLKYYNAAVPPTGTIPGIDLVTEGVVTLGKTLEIMQRYSSSQSPGDLVKLDKKDGATRLAHVLLEDSTEVRFLVGRAMNPAHQNPDMPISLSIKLRLVEDIAQCLRDAGKNVIVEHY